MGKKEKHIADWVTSKGFIVKQSDDDELSSFNPKEPKILRIGENDDHTYSASLLHEYYHGRQNQKSRLSWNKAAQLEAQAEEFVIRCFKCLGLDITHIEKWVNKYWLDYDTISLYYIDAAKILINKGLIEYE